MGETLLPRHQGDRRAARIITDDLVARRRSPGGRRPLRAAVAVSESGYDAHFVFGYIAAVLRDAAATLEGCMKPESR